MAGPFVLGILFGIGRALGLMLFKLQFWLFILCCAIVLGLCGLCVSYVEREQGDSQVQEQEDHPVQDTRTAGERQEAARADVPEAIIGDWRAGDYHRIYVQGGELGDVVAEFRVTYPAWGCAAEATLVEASESEIVLRPDRDGLDEDCIRDGWAEDLRLELGDEGSLWAYWASGVGLDGGAEFETLGQARTDVPEVFVGEWRDDWPVEEHRIGIRSGEVGDVVAELRATGVLDLDECVADAVLIRAFEYEILLRPQPADGMESDCERLGWSEDFHLMSVDRGSLYTPGLGSFVRS